MKSEQGRRGEPELSGLLSRKVKSPYERLRHILSQEHTTLVGRVSYWLYRHHGIGNATLAALIVSAGVLMIVAGFGHYQRPARAPLESDYSNEIQSIAQILGGIYAILLAVITFSVQTHAQRDDEGAFLASYLHRRHGSYWVSAVAAGATLANIFAPVARSFGFPISFPALLVIDVLLAPIVILWSLWFLHVTTRDVSLRVDDVISDRSDFRFEAFRRDVALAIAVDQFQADLVSQFQRLTERTRLSYSPYFGHFLGDMRQTESLEYKIPSGRYINDVNLDALRELAEILGSLPQDWRVRITVKPLARIPTGPSLIIIPAGADAKPQMSNQDARFDVLNAPLEPTVLKDKQRIQSLLDRAFVVGRPQSTPHELNEFFRRFGQRLLLAGIDGTSVKLKQSLESLTNFVRYWCKLGTDTNPGADPLWLMESPSAFVGPLAVDLYEVIKSAMESGDFGKAHAVLNFLINVAIIAYEASHARLFTAVTRYIPYAYNQGVRQRKIAGGVAWMMDGELHSLLWRFEARRLQVLDESGNGLNADLVAAQQPLLDQALSVCLHLVRSAMERGRVRDATNYFDRIYEHKRLDHSSMAFDPLPPNDKSPIVLEHYILIVMIGWALDLLETTKKARVKEAADAVMNMAIQRLPKRHRLVWLWERFEDSQHGSSLGQRLGISNWDPRDRGQRMRPGVSYSRSGGNPWLSYGFYFALLRAHASLDSETKDFFLSAPSAQFWDAGRIKVPLASMADRYFGHLSSESRAAVVENVVALIMSRELAARLKHIKETALAQIEPAVRDQLRLGIADGWRQDRAFAHEVLKSVTCSVHQSLEPRRDNWAYMLPRAYFLRSVVDFAYLGRNVAARQNTVEFDQADAAAKAVGQGSPETIASKLGAEVKALRSRGYEPDLIILPHGDKFVEALFRKPAYEVEDSNRLGDFFVGEWNGLKVARWPYTDAMSVLIGDMSRLFGKVAEMEAAPEVKLEEDGAIINEVVLRAEHASKLEEMPSATEMQVRVAVSMNRFFHVLDENAAVKFLVESPGV